MHTICLLILWHPSSRHPSFQGSPETFNLLREGPTSWVHRVLAVVHSLVAVALLVQAVVGGPAVGDNEGSWSRINLTVDDR